MKLWQALARGATNGGTRVVMHILDPIRGESSREVVIGREIDADTVRRFAEAGALHVVVDYAGGVPSSRLVSRDQWLRVRERREAAAQDADPKVWRRREELDVRVG
jgi:hypothetical protein